MATSAQIPKLERDNYSRVGLGLGVASTALQEILEEYIPHTDLPTILRHFSQHRLNKQQQNLVKKCDTEGYKCFDIPLLYKLLRNICTYDIGQDKPTLPAPTLGWDKVPRGDHLTLSDDIERLRLLRNSIHDYNAQAAIPEAEYRDIWQQLKDIYGRIQKQFNTSTDYVLALTNLETYETVQQGGKREERVPTEADIKELKEKLLVLNEKETTRIPVTPLQKKRALSLEQLYVPLVIREDLEYKSHLLNLDDHTSSPVSHQPITDPRDMFFIDNNPVRYVFLQGEAGRGKTVFCFKLLWHWCRAREWSNGDSHIALPLWETRMNQFEFVFLIQLRHVPDSLISVVDMICHYVFSRHEDCHDIVRHVLSSNAYRVLVLLDGLDEWNVVDALRTNYKYVPNIENMSNCILLFTSRPWKLELISEIIRDSDRVLEILGLEHAGIKTVIENVLMNFFKMDASSTQFKDKVREMLQKSEQPYLKSILNVPLIATALVHLWYANIDAGKSITTFYMSLIKMLIKRTIDEKNVDEHLVRSVKLLSVENFKMCEGLGNFTGLKDYIPLFYRVGKLAYEGLVLKENQLIFNVDKIEEEIGKNSLEFSSKVGLFSPSEAFQGLNYNFFHKTVQEFLSAIYTVCNRDISTEAFFKHLTSTKVLLEFDNVLIFMSGLSGALGHLISRKIAEVAKTDQHIGRYRETFRHNNNTVKLLYHLQLSCLRETQQKDAFQISDVYVGKDSDIDTVRMTADVLRHHNNKIVSMLLDKVPNDRTNGIDDAVILNFLRRTKTLTSLNIIGDSNRTLDTINTLSKLKALVLFNVSITPKLLRKLAKALQSDSGIMTLGLVYVKCEDTDEVRSSNVKVLKKSFTNLLQTLPGCIHLSALHVSYMLSEDENDMLANVLPQMSYLKSKHYYGSTVQFVEYDYSIVQKILGRTQLQELALLFVSLEDRLLELPANMDHIKEVVLHEVLMSGSGWRSFISSLSKIKHQFNVKLMFTDIHDDCVQIIRSSEEFTVAPRYNSKSDLFFERTFTEADGENYLMKHIIYSFEVLSHIQTNVFERITIVPNLVPKKIFHYY